MTPPRIIRTTDAERAISDLAREHQALSNMTGADSVALLQRENDHLASALAALEERMPTEEDMAYLRNRREQDERSAWVWQVIRQHAPWLIGIGGAIGTVIYWFLTHTVTIRSE